MNKGRFITGLIQWPTVHPYQLLIVLFLAISAMASGMMKLEFNNDYRVYFSQDNPQLQAFEQIQQDYNRSDAIMFVIQAKDGSVFTPDILQAIMELTAKGWKIPFSTRVDSLTNFQHTRAEGDELLVSDLVTDSDFTAEQLANIRNIAMQEPLLLNNLVSAKGDVAGVSVIVQIDQDQSDSVLEVVAMSRHLVKELESNYPQIKVYLTGMAMMNNAFNESALHDNQLLIPVMYICVILVMYLSLRSVSATLTVILLILCSVVSALGLAGWLDLILTPTSAIAPTIILTMAVADCIHILVTQLHNMRLGHEKVQALRESLRINLQPIFLTSVTTAIGFLSMNFSDAPPFRDLGNIVALGVILAWIFSISLLPALMTVLPGRVKLGDELDNSLMNKLAEKVIRYRRPLLYINIVVALAMLMFVPKNELNDEFVKYFDKQTEFRQGTDFLAEHMGGIYNIEISVQAKESGGISDPVYLTAVQQLVDWLAEQSEVEHIRSLTDILKRLNKNMHGDQPHWYQLPEQRELAAQYLLLYEMSLPYGLDLNDQIKIDKSGIRITVTLQGMSSNQMLELERRIRLWVEEKNMPYQVELASPILMFSHIGSRNIIRLMVGAVLALILISVLLMLAFKSLKLGLISLVPNLAPAGIAFGLWGLVNGQIGLGLSVVIGMTLGVVVDDTVHFISKYRRARLEKGLSSEDAVRYAFSSVGVALWVTSLILVTGFLILSLSHFTMNAEMGLMTAMTIAIALTLDLLFLPPLLMALDKR